MPPSERRRPVKWACVLGLTLLMGAAGGQAQGAEWYMRRWGMEFEGGLRQEPGAPERLQKAKDAVSAARGAPPEVRLHRLAALVEAVEDEEDRTGFGDSELIASTCAALKLEADGLVAAEGAPAALALAHAAQVAEKLGSIDCGGEEKSKTWIARALDLGRSLPQNDPDRLKVALVASELRGDDAGVRRVAEGWAVAHGEGDVDGLILGAGALTPSGVIPEEGTPGQIERMARADALVTAAERVHGVGSEIALRLRLKRALVRRNLEACLGEVDEVLASLERSQTKATRTYVDAYRARVSCYPFQEQSIYKTDLQRIDYRRTVFELAMAAVSPLDGAARDAYGDYLNALLDAGRIGAAEALARRYVGQVQAAAPANDLLAASLAAGLSRQRKLDADLRMLFLDAALTELQRSPSALADDYAQLAADSADGLMERGRYRELRGYMDHALSRPLQEGANPYLLPSLHFHRARALRALGERDAAIAELRLLSDLVAKYRELVLKDGYPNGDPHGVIASLEIAVLTSDAAGAKRVLAANAKSLSGPFGEALTIGGPTTELDVAAANRLIGRQDVAEKLTAQMALDLASKSAMWAPDIRSDAPFGSLEQRELLRGEIYRRLARQPVRYVEKGAGCSFDVGAYEIAQQWNKPCEFGAVALEALQSTAENPAGRTLALAQGSTQSASQEARELARQISDLRRQSEAAASSGRPVSALIEQRLVLERAYDALSTQRPPTAPRPVQFHDILKGLQGEGWRALSDADLKMTGAKPAALVALFDTPGGYVAAVVRYEPLAGTSRALLTGLPLTRQRAADLVARTGGKLPSQMSSADSLADIAPFDVAAAHELYEAVLGPLAAELEGVEDLTLYLEGPLAEQPAQLMVSALNGADQLQGAERYRTATWLGDRFRLRTTPSLAALGLKSKRAGAQAKGGLFVADPVLAGPGAHVSAAQDIDTMGGAGDIDSIRLLTPLPLTSEIATALSKSVPGSVTLTQAEATEAGLRRALETHNGVTMAAFATHGLGREDLERFRLAEPALVLTAPDTVEVTMDDGLLTKSEIAELHLEADWVLLIACNTAAPDAQGRGGALSGLAESFFFSGARSVLVSYWPVALKPTNALMQKVAARPAAERHEALREAMQAVRNDEKNPQWAHPAMWAPFVLVGD